MTRYLDAAAAGEARGAVVVVDVLRAFTTAAYAFAGGASAIWLVDSVEEALKRKAARPELLAMGEDGGRRIEGFDFANSPWEVSQADLVGRELVQRTSAGTRGVVAAAGAQRRWCTGLATATATARAVRAAGLGEPDYVITGRRGPGQRGEDDLLTAQLVERARVDEPIEGEATARAVAGSREAAVTLALGAAHVDPRDVELAVRVDAFDFAMEARAVDGGLCLTSAGLTA